MNYLQLVIACSSVPLNYPHQLLEFSNAQKKVGNLDNQIFSIDCFFEEPDSIDVIERKLIVIVLAPVLEAVLAAVIWLFVKLVRGKTKSVFSKLVASVIVLFFLLHPTITRYAFSLFECRAIDPGEYWLVRNLNVKCWESAHSSVALSLALPCLVVWVLLLPAVTLVYLCTHRSKLDALESKFKFGFLVNGYSRSAFYWEFVILYRKVAVVCFSVFLSTKATDIQAHSLLVVLLVAYLLHRSVQPYTTKQLNQLESRGILVSTVTIYSGMYFISPGISASTVLTLCILVILSNVYFLLYWVYLMSGVTVVLFLRYCPGIRTACRQSRILYRLFGNTEINDVVSSVAPLPEVSKEEQSCVNHDLIVPNVSFA